MFRNFQVSTNRWLISSTKSCGLRPLSRRVRHLLRVFIGPGQELNVFAALLGIAPEHRTKGRRCRANMRDIVDVIDSVVM